LTLLDAYALVALVADEPAAGEVEDLLRAGDARAVVINLAESIDVAQRVHGYDQSDVRGVLEPLVIGGALEPIASDDEVAWAAADLRGRYYDRRTRALSLADCFLLAHALAGEEIATSDPPLAEVAREEGVVVVALPGSDGKRP
jgi:predicted nucleic acid-binding protein